ncbi:hypothetical protein F2P56_029204 [Juglans regia]|uniref:Uncharacterized protein LOC109002355 n=2 Tax=Juglans regia TaxID=51240 RepID=A0A2I4FVD0_JUGRE|nr:uncharacterized protein LOC109002355 [Juglans regia]KAF5448697.1 hypothetical protein F2P56_029204 [Juglans regia]
MGGFTFAQVLVLIIATASMLAVSTANRGGPHWPFRGHGRRFHDQPKCEDQGPKKIIVGGSEQWRFNLTYTDWALTNGPFFINDTLVFKYDSRHSVYLLPDLWSFLNCDLSRAKLVGNVTQGGGKGFEYKLQEWKPHYFACGEHDGIHCNLGQMKFFVMPMLRCMV